MPQVNLPYCTGTENVYIVLEGARDVFRMSCDF